MTATDTDAAIARLGPFDLLAFLGQGAMGQVWRARHRAQGVPAAIKVVTEVRAQRPDYRRHFRQETRAVAGLSHPGLITVFDYGEVSREVEEATHGALRARSPYLAMELCPKGSLADIERQFPFASIRAILLSLLDALAHAHARGVVHRDIKPANILLGEASLGDDADWTGIKLTDFGLAFVAEGLDGAPRGACGTPAFMSPEQFRGQWRDIGPWTDLYSIGCLAHYLTCGEPPYRGRSIVEVAKKHLRAPVPRLEPRIEVPEEFEAWVRRLLQKNPLERYQNAADAAWPLLKMSPLDDRLDYEGSYDVGSRPSTLVLQPLENLLHSTDTDELLYATSPEVGEPPASSPPPDAAPLLEPTPAPLASDWQQLKDHRPSLRLLGAGLGLYGLRHIPLVGRHDERDALWRTLAETTQTRRPHAALVRGPSGLGKSSLAQWLCERAQETGAAICLRARHGRNTSGGEGLRTMLARHFRTAGLDRAEILERLRDWFRARGVDDPYKPDALAEIISPATEADVDAGQRKVQFARPEQRYALVASVLGLIARRRAVIVWLDDLQWSTDSLAFLRFCLDSDVGVGLPLVVVGTVRDEAIADDTRTQAHLARLTLDDAITHVELGPLSKHEQADFIERLLYLAPPLARRVADRTGGNPLFAVQLVGDWVDRGVLEVGERGFVLADDEQAPVPNSIFDVWSSRLDELLDDDASLHALELAAVLGQDVDEHEWRACLALADEAFPACAVESLLQQRLFEETDLGFRFIHGMLRETLVRRAREGARCVAHNRVCAAMLQARYADEPQLSERLGRHLLAAQAYDDALAPLYEGAMRCGNAAELDRSLTLLDLRREAIDRIEAPSQAARASAENKALRGLTKAVMGKRELATTFARAALEEAEALDDPCLIATCCYRLAQTYLFLNDFDACLPLLARGRDLVEEHDCERRLLMDLEGVTGQALARLGRADEAIEHLYRARDIADTIGRTLKLDNILWALGSCERHRGNLAEAETLLEDAIARAEQLGHQMTVARALVSLGDVVRLQGRLDDAAELYRRVLDYGHSERQHETLIGRLNLALVAIQTGDFDEAAPILDRLEELYEERNNRTMLLYVAVMKLACLADRGAWTELDAHVDHVQRELDDTQLVDADVAICLDAAARLCSTANQPHHARRLYEAAAHQWEAAGAHEKAHATRKKLPQ